MSLGFAEIDKLVRNWRRPLLLTHARPDGDALGSLTSVERVLAGRGAAPLAVVFEPLPRRLALFARLAPLAVLDNELPRKELDSCDGVIVLDTCTYAQLEPVAAWLRNTRVPKLAVDHHVSRDPLADAYLVDEGAAANCLILYEWFVAAGIKLDVSAAEALFVGLATDTGWFRHSNTDARALRAGAALVELGARPHALFERLYQQDSAGRLRLLGAALGSMELLCGARLAVMLLPASRFGELKADYSDTEDFINEPLRIESVEVSVLLVEHGDGVVRVSFRSKSPSVEGAAGLDVAGIASAFGGGGHQRAAGARIRGGLAEVRLRVVERITASLGAR